MAEPDLYRLPDGLPVPEDDAACDHLPDLRLPHLELPSTSGSPVDLSALSGRTVVYCYPLTGPPDGGLPEGWDAIPGARGCTPQSCAFRDYHGELRGLGVRVFGLSTQSTAYQREAAQRLGLPFELLSDEKLHFAEALRLPTFEADSTTLIRRLTLVLRNGGVEKVFYPVFPPDQNAAEVVGWLSGEGCKG
ncbi:MAG: peroxiredoxin [Rubrobacter sp.]|nr:peroxiredoxin [Rubrobacter sp.]